MGESIQENPHGSSSLISIIDFLITAGASGEHLDIPAFHQLIEKHLGKTNRLFQKVTLAADRELGKPEPNLFRLVDEILYIMLYEREALIFSGSDPVLQHSLTEAVESCKTYRALALRKIKSSLLDKRQKHKLIRRLFEGVNRLVVLVTHSCQLRCSYCRVGKYAADMPLERIKACIMLLLTSGKDDLQLQFFGGEPLLRFAEIKEAVLYAEQEAKKRHKELTFIITTNGIALTKEKLAFLSRHRVTIELSLDGSAEAQASSRISKDPAASYAQITENIAALVSSGIRNYAIMVVVPETVSKVQENVASLLSLGFKAIQLNYALGRVWPEEKFALFRGQLNEAIAKHSPQYGNSFILNLTERREPVVLNAEVTVDCDGDIFLETGICIEEDFKKIKEMFRIGRLDQDKDIDLLSTTRFLNLYKLTRAYSEAAPGFRQIVLNNIQIGESLNI